jgi:Protein of unknown function (DUF2752)
MNSQKEGIMAQLIIPVGEKYGGKIGMNLASLTIPKTLQLAGLSAICAVSAIPLYLMDPATSGVFPSCPFRALTGMYCPGCGTLRALHGLLHLNIGAAFMLNPLTVLILPLIIYAFVSLVAEVVRGRPLPRLFDSPRYTWALFAVVMLFWVLRNIPMYPFNLFKQ